MRQVEQIMGLPITIEILGDDTQAAFEKSFRRLKAIDERYSTYKTASEVSRYARGELAEPELSQELKAVIKQCRDWQAKTEGYFSAWAGGKFDPSGYVKGWAIAEAGRVIENCGYKTYCIGAGGDILARSDGAKRWSIGIQDPTDRTKILNKLSILNGAVCTSGNYERGSHIINPKTNQPADSLKSVTITGPDVITADVLATAVFAAGLAAGRKILKNFDGYEAFIVT